MAKTKKVSRLSLIMGENSNGSNSQPDWKDVNADLVKDLIVSVSNRQGAVRFGYTRERTSYSVGLYLDDDSATMYCGPNQDLDEFLEHLIARVDNLD